MAIREDKTVRKVLDRIEGGLHVETADLAPCQCRSCADGIEEMTLISGLYRDREDLAMIVRRLVRRLPADDTLRVGAAEYLKRKGLTGLVIRAAGSSNALVRRKPEDQ